MLLQVHPILKKKKKKSYSNLNRQGRQSCRFSRVYLARDVPGVHLPQSHSLLGVVEALDGAEEVGQRVLGVPADECEEDAGREQRGLGAPALLREVRASGSAAAGQQQGEQGGGEAGESGHGGGQINKCMAVNFIFFYYYFFLSLAVRLVKSRRLRGEVVSSHEGEKSVQRN